MLGITAFSDATLSAVVPIAVPQTVTRSAFLDSLLFVIGGATVLLSIQPVLNLFANDQLMNYSYNRFHLVNTYGAFGSVTKNRYEIVIEGTDELFISSQTRWQEYGFKGKPGDPRRMPPQVAPYHLRLDWLMWFLPFSVAVTQRGIQMAGYDIWFLRMIEKLLEGDRATLKLLKQNPFDNRPPTFVRALFYLYRYTSSHEKKETGAWWTRQLVDVYLPPVSLAELRQVA